MEKQNKKLIKGFTLIELLVVVAIIGLLSSVVFASLNSTRAKARDARRIADLHQIQLGLQVYYNDYGHFPTVSSWIYSCDSSWNSLQTALQSSFPNQLPKDPINTCPAGGPWVFGNYAYVYGSNGGDKYDLVTALEDTSSSYRCGVKGYRYHDFGGEQFWCTAFGGTWSNQLYADH